MRDYKRAFDKALFHPLTTWSLWGGVVFIVSWSTYGFTTSKTASLVPASSGAICPGPKGGLGENPGGTNGNTATIPTEEDCAVVPRFTKATPAEEAATRLAEAETEPLAPIPQADGCACGDDCRCSDPMICKNGHCMKPYAIVFSTDGCAPCAAMYDDIRELRAGKLPVYLFHSASYPKALEAFGVRVFPTTVIVRDGREASRIEGVTTARDISERLR